MHELALAQSIVEIALRTLAAQSKESRVTLVKLRIGKMTNVEPEALRYGFLAAANGTAAQGATLVLETAPIVVFCRNCSRDFSLQEYRFSCIHCGSAQTEIRSGREMAVEYVEVE